MGGRWGLFSYVYPISEAYRAARGHIRRIPLCDILLGDAVISATHRWYVRRKLTQQVWLAAAPDPPVYRVLYYEIPTHAALRPPKFRIRVGVVYDARNSPDS